jgi:hypothetical protein
MGLNIGLTAAESARFEMLEQLMRREMRSGDVARLRQAIEALDAFSDELIGRQSHPTWVEPSAEKH